MTDLATPLARVIAQVESSTWPDAMRFENVMYDRGSFQIPVLTAIQTANRCSKPTAMVIYCTSYGLFQIMGNNLWGWLAYKGSVAYYLNDAETQLVTFQNYCHTNGFDPATFDFGDADLVARFAKSYNGPGNVADYSAKMMAAFHSLPPVAGD